MTKNVHDKTTKQSHDDNSSMLPGSPEVLMEKLPPSPNPSKECLTMIPTSFQENQHANERNESDQFDLLDFSSFDRMNMNEVPSQHKPSDEENIESLRQLCQPSPYQQYPYSYGINYGYGMNGIYGYNYSYGYPPNNGF